MISAAWGGSACGRIISMWRDKTDTKFNRMSAGVEAAVAFAVGMPWLVWLLT